jgi:hypothetical protein
VGKPFFAKTAEAALMICIRLTSGGKYRADEPEPRTFDPLPDAPGLMR